MRDRLNTKKVSINTFPSNANSHNKVRDDLIISIPLIYPYMIYMYLLTTIEHYQNAPNVHNVFNIPL